MLHGEDSEPLSQPLDETAVMISGTGKRHGRFRILDALVESSTTLTRVRATSTSDTLSMLPRPRRGGSTQTCGDDRWEEAYDQLHEVYLQKMQEYEEAVNVADSHQNEINKWEYNRHAPNAHGLRASPNGHSPY
ncbi:hypothetical protein ACQ4PT_051736 [Festuca glaucescens]